MHTAPYDEYVLEVTDTNVAARKVYEKLGFETFEVKLEENMEEKGFSERIYMKRGKKWK